MLPIRWRGLYTKALQQKTSSETARSYLIVVVHLFLFVDEAWNENRLFFPRSRVNLFCELSISPNHWGSHAALSCRCWRLRVLLQLYHKKSQNDKNN
jgi:hypothetical protein